MVEDKIRGIKRDKLMKYFICYAKIFGFYPKGEWKDDGKYLKGWPPDCSVKKDGVGRKGLETGKEQPLQ